MKVLLIGGTGKVGVHVLRELESREHEVTLLARHPEPAVAEFPELRVVAGDAFDIDVVRKAADGCELILSSVAMRDAEQFERSAVELSRVLSQVATELGVRWLSVGGAGSLEIEPGVQWVDRDDFPEASRRESGGFRAALQMLRTQAPADLQWTVLSPPPMIDQTLPRTGDYRTGDDAILRAADGTSAISAPDLAVALVDEVERAAHVRARFTVAY